MENGWQCNFVCYRFCFRVVQSLSSLKYFGTTLLNQFMSVSAGDKGSRIVATLHYGHHEIGDKICEEYQSKDKTCDSFLSNTKKVRSKHQDSMFYKLDPMFWKEKNKKWKFSGIPVQFWWEYNFYIYIEKCSFVLLVNIHIFTLTNLNL